MKLDLFEKIIRRVVREEIDYALKREFTLLKEEVKSKNIVKEEIISKQEVETFSPKKKKFVPQNYTNNSTLNSLLNETALSLTSENFNPFSNGASVHQPFSSPEPIMDTTGMPEVVANAVTRDYSALMKAIDAKKNK
jgi:hypothetical protein